MSVLGGGPGGGSIWARRLGCFAGDGTGGAARARRAGGPQGVLEVARNDDNKCKRRGRINRKKSKTLKRNGRRPKSNQAK